jgi:hypothetical protein
MGRRPIVEAVTPTRGLPRDRIHPPEPDYAAIRRELQTNKHVTLQLLWEEYRDQSPDGYRYSRYVVAVFMLPRNAGPQTFCSSTSSTATLIDDLPRL